jgi:hypothetical protein
VGGLTEYWDNTTLLLATQCQDIPVLAFESLHEFSASEHLLYARSDHLSSISWHHTHYTLSGVTPIPWLLSDFMLSAREVACLGFGLWVVHYRNSYLHQVS